MASAVARSKASTEKSGLRATFRIGSSHRAQSAGGFGDLERFTTAPWLGGWMSGAIDDLTGSYQAAFLNGIAWNLLNMSIALWLLLGRLRPHAARA